MFIFSYLFTGENGKKGYETCLSIIQEEENWKIKNCFGFELKIKWTNDPRTLSVCFLQRVQALKSFQD